MREIVDMGISFVGPPRYLGVPRIDDSVPEEVSKPFLGHLPSRQRSFLHIFARSRYALIYRFGHIHQQPPDRYRRLHTYHTIFHDVAAVGYVLTRSPAVQQLWEDYILGRCILTDAE